MSREYGVSVVSLFPYSWGAGGFERSVDLARKCGFHGIQILPMRGWDFSDRRYDRAVLSYEDAWDYAGLLGTIRSKLRGNWTPTFLDWVLFRGLRTPLFADSILSVHEFVEPGSAVCDTVVEIHPELSTDIATYVEYVNRGGRLCWDTRHVRRPHRDGAKNLKWRELLRALPDSSIGLIHVQPLDKSELNDFLSGRFCEIQEMLWKLRRKAPGITAIVESNPKLGFPSSVVSYFSKFRSATANLLGG